METITTRKNVLLGFSLIYWVFALVLYITNRKELTKDENKILIESLVFAAIFFVCGCIPFVGWILSIVVFVFYVIKIVNVFRGNYNYNVPLVSLLAGKFNN